MEINLLINILINILRLIRNIWLISIEFLTTLNNLNSNRFIEIIWLISVRRTGLMQQYPIVIVIYLFEIRYIWNWWSLVVLMLPVFAVYTFHNFFCFLINFLYFAYFLIFILFFQEYLLDTVVPSFLIFL